MTTDGGDDSATAIGPFDIYETADGPRHVGNPVRRLILGKMRGTELTVPEIIHVTGLTKSTISAHLTVLYKDRMVAYREDPSDRRRKFYYLTARHVGTTRRCSERIPFHGPDEGDPSFEPSSVGRVLLRALLAELACCGLDLAPVVRETGRRVGELLGKGTGPRDLERWVEDAAGFWSDAGLGELVLIRSDPPVLEVRSCGLCFPEADSRMSLCAVAGGILEGMASEALHTLVEAEQIEPSEEARASGGCGCRFRLRLHEVGAAAFSPEASRAAGS